MKIIQTKVGGTTSERRQCNVIIQNDNLQDPRGRALFNFPDTHTKQQSNNFILLPQKPNSFIDVKWRGVDARSLNRNVSIFLLFSREKTDVLITLTPLQYY